MRSWFPTGEESAEPPASMDRALQLAVLALMLLRASVTSAVPPSTAAGPTEGPVLPAAAAAGTRPLPLLPLLLAAATTGVTGRPDEDSACCCCRLPAVRSNRAIGLDGARCAAAAAAAVAAMLGGAGCAAAGALAPRDEEAALTHKKGHGSSQSRGNY